MRSVLVLGRNLGLGLYKLSALFVWTFYRLQNEVSIDTVINFKLSTLPNKSIRGQHVLKITAPTCEKARLKALSRVVGGVYGPPVQSFYRIEHSQR